MPSRFDADGFGGSDEVGHRVLDFFAGCRLRAGAEEGGFDEQHGGVEREDGRFGRVHFGDDAALGGVAFAAQDAADDFGAPASSPSVSPISNGPAATAPRSERRQGLSRTRAVPFATLKWRSAVLLVLS